MRSFFHIILALFGRTPAQRPSPLARLGTRYAYTQARAWENATDITRECGVYQIRQALWARGRQAILASLYRNKLFQRWDWVLPWDITSKLRERRVPAKAYYYFSRRNFEQIVAEALARRHAVIVLMRATRGRCGLHWVSIWGYEADTKVFLVYDSQYATAHGGIGNTRYTPAFLERRFPWWFQAAIEVG